MDGSEIVRVAVTLPRRDTRAWHRRAVECLRDVRGVRLVAVVVTDGPPRTSDGPRGDPGLRRVSPDEIAPDAPRIAPEARANNAHVVLDFAGGDPPRGADAPPFGVWRHGFGDGAACAGGAPGTLARLYRATADPDAGVVLHEGWYRRAAAVSLRVAPWSARALRQLVGGDTALLAGAPRAVADSRDPLPDGAPASWGTRLTAAVRGWGTRERWTVGVIGAGLEAILDRGRLPEPTWLAGQPDDRYYADPFPLAREGDRLRVLVEDYRYRERRGRLTELEIGGGGELLTRRERLAPPHHVSYPFVLRHEGRLVCVPEGARTGRLRAFDYDPGTDAWRPGPTLLEGVPAVDPTLVRHDGRWWLFCTRWDEENQTELHLFHAPAFTGPWAPHPLNPVKSDARSSRPAGALFTLGGALYRPAQDCARRYGAAVVINRVRELSPRGFREESVARLAPAPASAWPDGLHTLNGLDGITVVDGLRV